MTEKTRSEWLRFDLFAHRPKTKVWSVVSRSSGAKLGTVKWFARWRQYTFFPEPETTFNAGCLNEIIDFCVRQNVLHKQRLE